MRLFPNEHKNLCFSFSNFESIEFLSSDNWRSKINQSIIRTSDISLGRSKVGCFTNNLAEAISFNHWLNHSYDF